MQDIRRPLVSVVIIFFNAERFIKEAIASVFAQNYQTWELILVDDGCTDGSTAIAQNYAIKNPDRVLYLEHADHRNQGMSASRNLGIFHASGEYVTFLDADDVWSPTILEEQVAILESQPEAALVYGRLLYWYSWTGRAEDRQRDYVEKLGVPSDALLRPPELIPLFLLDRAAVPSGILVRREAIDNVGGFEDAFRGEYEDQVFCAKICLHAAVFVSSNCWYLYRQHEQSCVSIGQRSGATQSARLFFLNWLATYLSNRKVRSPQVWFALYYELLRCKYPEAFEFLKRGEQIASQWTNRLRQSWTGKWNLS